MYLELADLTKNHQHKIRSRGRQTYSNFTLAHINTEIHGA